MSSEQCSATIGRKGTVECSAGRPQTTRKCHLPRVYTHRTCCPPAAAPPASLSCFSSSSEKPCACQYALKHARVRLHTHASVQMCVCVCAPCCVHACEPACARECGGDWLCEHMWQMRGVGVGMCCCPTRHTRFHSTVLHSLPSLFIQPWFPSRES